MPETESGFAPSGSARIAYDSVGDGAAAVFIHAGVADRRMWRHQLSAVPAGFQFVSLDLRAHGDTVLPDETFSNHVDVVAVMDHLGIEKAVVVGCSMGGGTAIDVALTAPERVTALVLVGAGAPGADIEDYEPPQWPEILKAYEAGDFDRVAELDAEVWVVGYGRDREAVDRAVIAELIEMDRRLLPNEGRRDELLTPIDPPRAERMGEISVPALVVVGENDLPDTRQSADHLAATLSDGPAVVIPDAAHLPSLEQPAAFNGALFGFLRRFRA
jgi:pimeloyl-ACP methyl ester carboxylesterase